MAQVRNLQYTAINLSSSGNSNLLTAVAAAGGGTTSPPLNIWGIAIVVGGATNLTFFDGTNQLTGALPMLANGSIFTPMSNTAPWFKVSPGNNFILNSSSGVQVSGWIVWSE